ncbi:MULTISPECIES: flagellar protein FliT [unclassified Janthinobacterium]|jgi:flagellar protein FliT|uniref:Flagellar protein FliT n=1 Tax=Janthinobacterium lividum TaxID=29581 RepID=A0A1E8PTW7_9BURK|nr:flagellar protein FliT [Janthinobacterium sp. CG_23.4]MDH6159143.1 flagellar protein FliT [Janthinobacterium sp. CG_23.4]OFJ49768.1 flagellar protein FliT [Janthinobacterium lividum]
MMTNQEVLSTYETMQSLTGQMVTAASNADWDALDALEQQVSAHVATLKANEEKVVLESAGRQRKVALIKQILEDDRKIRDLTMPWMAQLSNLINSTGTERRLANAYGV